LIEELAVRKKRGLNAEGGGLALFVEDL